MRTSGFGLSAWMPTRGVSPMRSRTLSCFTGCGRSAAGDRGQDRHDVALGDRRGELLEVADVVVVHVHVDELVQRAGVIDELAREPGVRGREIGEQLTDRRALRG